MRNNGRGGKKSPPSRPCGGSFTYMLNSIDTSSCGSAIDRTSHDCMTHATIRAHSWHKHDRYFFTVTPFHHRFQRWMWATTSDIHFFTIPNEPFVFYTHFTSGDNVRSCCQRQLLNRVICLKVSMFRVFTKAKNASQKWINCNFWSPRPIRLKLSHTSGYDVKFRST